MDELITWLRAQLDDDERAIERMRRASIHGVESDAEEDYLMFASRAPAEVDAKRRIIDRYQAQLDRQGDWQESQLAADICATEYADWILPVLALPYADREGYRSEWAP